VHDERQRRERLGIERDVGPTHLDAIGTRAEIGARLGFDQRPERDRRPVEVGDLVMRARQSVDSAAENAGEFLHAGRGVLALCHQGANQAQDVANAMVELGDHQLLPLLGTASLARGEVRQLQDDLEQRDAQAFGNADVRRRPRF